jgi:hypothetical protein
MSTPFQITPPLTIGEAVVPIVRMTDDEFKILLEAISGPKSFSLSKERLEDLQKKIPSSGPALTYLLSILAFLYSQIDRVVDLGEQFPSAISKLVEELNTTAKWGDQHSKAIARFSAVLERKETHKRFRKVQRLQSGFIPNAVGFSSFVDLRPDFGEGDAPSLQGYLRMIQMRISTDADMPEHRRFVFQLTEDGLSELKKTVERLELKLAELKKDDCIATRIIE